MRRAGILAVVALLASGCASTPPTYFKPNVSQQEFQRDIWECQQIVNQSYQPPQQSSGPGGAGAAIGYMLGRAMSAKEDIETACSAGVIRCGRSEDRA